MATRIEFICEVDQTEYLLFREIDKQLSVSFFDSTNYIKNKEIILSKSDCLELINHLQLIYKKL